MARHDMNPSNRRRMAAPAPFAQAISSGGKSHMLSDRMAIGRQAALNALLVVLSLAIGLAALEAGGRAVATVIARQGKLFRPDAELGWTPLPT
jgi:hypothetical protein